MIEVDQLEKWYGFAHALKGVSFAVAKGEVVGFLGPNGAGKSTTMKILTGFLLPSGGRAAIDGRDVVSDSLAVRRRIGYLPESTPLYGEMRVDEYLRFAAEIRGVGRGRCAVAVARAAELCGLSRVLGKNILELSKGYKQRVGLAQAIVHEPPVLILDEPTSGLDPNQIVEVRKLIARLGEEHTVVLSTHYLQEVERSCTRAIIVSQGRIVADGSQAELLTRLPKGPLRVTLRAAAPTALAACQAICPAAAVVADAVLHDAVTLRVPDVDEAALAAHLVASGLPLLELQRERGTLEQVFAMLTLQDSKEVLSA